VLTTTRRGISYPNPDRSDRADISLHIGNIATAADADVIFNQGTDAARVAAAHQSGGGRFWWATDTGLLWYDDGTTWRSVAPTSSSVGTLALRPAATSMVAGSTYFASDQIVDYITDGTNWIRKSAPAGSTQEWFKPDAAVPTGWVLYDGSNLPASTGIYADLYAHLGNTLTKPDTRGRNTVGLGTHGDVNGIGVNEGQSVNNRRPRHKHTKNGTVSKTGAATLVGTVGFSDPSHAHTLRGSQVVGINTPYTTVPYNDNYGTDPVGELTNYAYTNITVNNGSLAVSDGIGVTDSITVGPQTGAEPTDSSAYIVCAKIAKL
jgi:hypothetical protein